MAAINAPCPTGDCRNHRVSQQPSIATESFSVNYGKCLPKLQKSTKKKTATRTSPTSAPSSDLHDQNGTKSEERVDHDGTKSSPNYLNRISPNRGQSQAQAQQRCGAHDRHESCPKKVMVTRLDSVPL